MAGTGWSNAATRALIAIWGESSVQEKLDSVTRKKVIYEDIAEKLRAQGFEYTWKRCRTKVKNLTQKYRLLYLLYRCLLLRLINFHRINKAIEAKINNAAIINVVHYTRNFVIIIAIIIAWFVLHYLKPQTNAFCYNIVWNPSMRIEIGSTMKHFSFSLNAHQMWKGL